MRTTRSWLLSCTALAVSSAMCGLGAPGDSAPAPAPTGLEWEQEQKNITGIDVFQIKSLLILGAIRPDFLEYPNREWGYGQLNLYNTFEAMRQL